MFIKHPKENALINVIDYGDIRTCTVNVTHVDFYVKPLPQGKKRGKPDLTLVFDTEKERDDWFKKLEKQLEY